ncbi:outer membrane protein [Mesorhizobium sp. ANAO-SY3R2]|uniref:outer membrane protein n=1 Tax=Mesorhizobium sp. ANAO-SY3R2 TaxID=3166644 RepID=UPI00366EFFCB
MKTTLLASTFLFAVSGSAFAADAVVYQEGAAAYNWSGLYVGAAIGYSSIRTEDVGEGQPSIADGGLGSAIYAGYNFQYRNWVFGAEADLKFSNAEVEDIVYPLPYIRPIESRVAGSLRGRVGYSLGQVMPYATGGLAMGSFRVDHAAGKADVLATETITGYVVGGGVEWAATDKLIVRAEYLFSDYGTDDFEFSFDTHEFDVRTHDVRLGVAYMF